MTYRQVVIKPKMNARNATEIARCHGKCSGHSDGWAYNPKKRAIEPGFPLNEG
jgi:hypothetical protein